MRGNYAILALRSSDFASLVLRAVRVATTGSAPIPHAHGDVHDISRQGFAVRNNCEDHDQEGNS